MSNESKSMRSFVTKSAHRKNVRQVTSNVAFLSEEGVPGCRHTYPLEGHCRPWGAACLQVSEALWLLLLGLLIRRMLMYLICGFVVLLCSHCCFVVLLCYWVAEPPKPIKVQTYFGQGLKNWGVPPDRIEDNFFRLPRDQHGADDVILLMLDSFWTWHAGNYSEHKENRSLKKTSELRLNV